MDPSRPTATFSLDLVHALPDPLLVLHETGRLVYCNPALVDRWGVKPELLQPEDARPLISYLASQMSTDIEEASLWDWLFPEPLLSSQHRLAERSMEVTHHDGTAWRARLLPYHQRGELQGSLLLFQPRPESLTGSDNPGEAGGRPDYHLTRRIRNVLAGFRGVVIEYRQDGRRIYHGAVRDLTGYDPDAFTGGTLQWNGLLNGKDARLRDSLLAQAKATPNFDRQVTYPLTTRRGEVCRVSERIRSLDGDDRVTLVCMIQDITAHHALKADLARQQQFERRLLRMTDALYTHTHSRTMALSEALREVMNAFACDGTHLAEIGKDDESDEEVFIIQASVASALVPQAHQVLPEETVAWRPHFRRWQQAVGAGEVLTGHVDTLPAVERSLIAGREMQSIVLVPVMKGEHPLGFLMLESRHRRGWDPQEINHLRTLASLFVPWFELTSLNPGKSQPHGDGRQTMPGRGLEASGPEETLAERTARYASIGALVAAVNHELNQPLNALRMGVEGVLLWMDSNPALLPDFAKRNLGDMRAAVDRIAHAVENLHRYAVDAREPVPTVCDLNEIVQDALSVSHRRLQNHQIRVELDLSGEPVRLTVRRLHVEQIISHYLHNAISALDVTSRTDKLVIIRTQHADGEVRVIVEDNGPGLDTDDLDSLFDLPTSGTRGEDPVGLGLPMVKVLARREGAQVDASPGGLGGAAFSVTFPVSVTAS